MAAFEAVEEEEEARRERERGGRWRWRGWGFRRGEEEGVGFRCEARREVCMVVSEARERNERRLLVR